MKTKAVFYHAGCPTAEDWNRQTARHNGSCPRHLEIAGPQNNEHKPPMTKTLERYLDNAAGAGRVMAHARLLLRLTQRFKAVVPSGLKDVARIANFKSGKVVIHAENGAAASKIRQMSQRLCEELSRAGVDCNGIEVRVQPSQIPFHITASAAKPLSAKTFGVLRSTSENLPEGPLRKALDALLASAAKQE